MAVEKVGVRREELKHFGEAAGGEVVVAADASALLEVDGPGEAPCGEHLVCDLERLLEADRSTQAVPADLEEDLVRGIVVRIEKELGEDFGKRARLPVNGD